MRDRTADIRPLAESGLCADEIAERLDLRADSVRRACRKAGIRLSRKRPERPQAGASVARVRELAAAGMPAGVIATEIGLSRQRVYQIARREGISLPRYHAVPRHIPTRPKPRVITGGVAQEINHSTAGTIAELLAAADLMARGWQVYRPLIASRGHDLIATKDDKIITVEVRSAYRNAAGRLIFARKPDCKSSTYALVVTGEPVSYDPPI